MTEDRYESALRLEELFGGPQIHDRSPETDVDSRNVPFPSRHRQPQPETHLRDEWREIKIAERDCPMPGCYGRLDDDFNCAGCGNTSLPAASVAVLPERPVPQEEFAPSQITDAA